MPKLRREAQTEYPNVLAVPAIKAAGLLHQTENPLRSASLHPDRGTFDLAGQEINGRANSDSDGHPERAIIHRYPLLLFRTAERDKEEVRLRLENALADFLVIHLEQLIERRRIETGDEEFGMAALHIGDGALLGAKAGLMTDALPGKRYLGAPAVEERQFFRSISLIQQLPEIRRQLHEAQRAIIRLAGESGEAESRADAA